MSLKAAVSGYSRWCSRAVGSRHSGSRDPRHFHLGLAGGAGAAFFAFRRKGFFFFFAFAGSGSEGALAGSGSEGALAGSGSEGALAGSVFEGAHASPIQKTDAADAAGLPGAHSGRA